MKKMFFPIGVVLASATVIVLAQFAFAALKREARVTQVIRDVRLLASHAAPRPASINDNVHEGTAVRTGSDSRAELTYTDQMITRLGANTVFSSGAGVNELGSGAILVYAPKSAGEIRVNTSAATAAVTGFTALFEFHSKSWNKFLLLEGHGSISLKRHPGDTRDLHSGQIIIFRPDAVTLPAVQDVDVCKLIGKSLLITQFPKLPSWDLILAVCERQKTSPPSSTLIDPTSLDTIDQSINGHPPPPPPKPGSTP